MESLEHTRGTVLVTGPRGNVGREVVRHLIHRGVPVRLALRQDPGTTAAGTESVRFDFNDPQTYRPAVQGCDAVFLLRPPAISDTKSTLNVLVDTARAAGVRRLVFLSVAGAADRRYVPHHAVEQRLTGGPDDWTILRAGFFAQNIASAYRDDILDEDRIYVPARDGRVAFVDLRDVGQVAADALVDGDRHGGRRYTLTGPKAFTFAEVAAELSDATGRPIRYEPASIVGYYRHLRRSGLVRGHAAIQTILHVGLLFGQAEAVDPTLATLLDAPPHDVRAYIRDHVDVWRR